MFHFSGNLAVELSPTLDMDWCLHVFRGKRKLQRVFLYVPFLMSNCPVSYHLPPSLSLLLPRGDAWQIYSSAAYGRMTDWSFVNPECNEKTKGFVLSEVGVSKRLRERARCCVATGKLTSITTSLSHTKQISVHTGHRARS